MVSQSIYYTARAMDMRAEVWSPLQNTAVWLGAWLFGHESTDALLAALIQLGGRPTLASADDESTLAELDGVSAGDAPFTDALAQLRQATAPLLEAGPGEPVLRLLLSGPGEPPALPAGSAAARAAAASPAGALVVRTEDPEFHLVAVPEASDAGTRWHLLPTEGILPAPAWLSPGDADTLLRQATDEAAALIEGIDYVRKHLPNPRLTVGTLSDFYDTPGLPGSVPARSAQLFARADRVAAIIETVTDRLGDHQLDPQLLRLWRHIRQARMAGVAYAMTDFAR